MIITPAKFEDEVNKIVDNKAEVVLKKSVELMAETLASLGYEAGVDKIMDALIENT